MRTWIFMNLVNYIYINIFLTASETNTLSLSTSFPIWFILFQDKISSQLTTPFTESLLRPSSLPDLLKKSPIPFISIFFAVLTQSSPDPLFDQLLTRYNEVVKNSYTKTPPYDLKYGGDQLQNSWHYRHYEIMELSALQTNLLMLKRISWPKLCPSQLIGCLIYQH